MTGSPTTSQALMHEKAVLLYRGQHFHVPEGVDCDTPCHHQLEFKCDSIVFSRGRDIFVVHSSTKQPCFEDLDLEELEAVNTPIRVDPEHVFPKFDPQLFTQAPDPVPANCYAKSPRLTAYALDPAVDILRTSYLVEREARACEVLCKTPHPNIAKYLGCVVEDGRIVGLCYQKYTKTLQKRAESKKLPLEKDELLQGIRDGIEYIHSHGFCHNDIHDRNVMFGDDDVPVIIDFDSCIPEGEVLSWKGGHPNWSDDDFRTSEQKNDYYSLRKMEEYLNDAYARQDRDSTPKSELDSTPTSGSDNS